MRAAWSLTGGHQSLIAVRQALGLVGGAGRGRLNFFTSEARHESTIQAVPMSALIALRAS